MLRLDRNSNGFALPTVLIASVVMLSLMAVSVSSVATIRVSLKEQHYEQLAKVAGEAGVAYARACLAKNANIPQWSNVKPLTPATNCSGDPASGSPSLYLVEQDDLRSSFSVGMPVLDNDGRAVSIPQTGFVQLLRKSDGVPWRTYQQPSSQLASAPDLCFSGAIESYGWGSAYYSESGTTTLTGPGSTAKTIDPGYWPRAGYTYLRKDFYAPFAGTYRATARLSSSNSFSGDLFIDGTQHLSDVTGTQKTSGNISLSAGCHTVVIRILSNILSSSSPTESRVAAAIYKNGASAPILSTDNTWRRNAGPQREFSHTGYHATPNLWSTVFDGGVHASWPVASSTTGNSTARAVTPTFGRGGDGNSTAARYYYIRSPGTFTVPGNEGDTIDVRLSMMCDDSCDVYLSGRNIMSSSGSTTVTSTMVSMPAGEHTIGVALYNSGTTPNPTRLTLSAVLSGTTILQTNSSWLAANAAYTSPTNLVSSDRFFVPYP